VKFSLESLKPGSKVKGTTIAELGNRNRPLDMIVYQKDGKSFILVANSDRGVMKVSTDAIEKNQGITSKVSDTAGQPFETIKDLTGVVQLDKLNETQAVVVVQKTSGMDLKTIALP
jgi:hypothetical protein